MRRAIPQPPGSIIWEPTPAVAQASLLFQFMERNGIASYDELMRRSVEDLEWFWGAVVRDLGISWYRPYERVLDTTRGVAWARWFVGGQLNVANDCLDKHLATQRRSAVALIWEGEPGEVRRLTYAELHSLSNRMAHGLRRLGIGRGDRVGVYLPMLPETAIVLLALAKVGAVAAPIFSGYAAPAVAARLEDCGARCLITADGFYRRQQPIAMKPVADAAVALAPSVEHVIMVRRLGTDVPWQDGRDVAWDDLVASQPDQFTTEPMDAEEPLLLMYTSGTTGRPKGTVHVHSGFPIKVAQDLAHAFDLQPGDTLFWFTDIGWMMGPWVIYGSLMLGATMLLYEGAPDCPGPDRLWALAERHAVTHLGLSPTLIRGLQPAGDAMVRTHDLSHLRILGSAGETWNPEPYMWYFNQVGGGRCPIINYSGGTEISGGIVSGNLLRPIKPLSFAGPVPGIAADVVDAEGRSVRGEVGELVIRQPWPGMTRGFWKDPDRYIQTYWDRWSGVWVHGDWASVDTEGFWYIHGRSDDVLKVAGKRVGPAEIESALTAHPAVMEAAAIGVPHPVKGETVVVFVTLRGGHKPAAQLAQKLEELVVASLGKSLRPTAVHFVNQLPKTRSAKIMRRVIRAVYLGQKQGDLSSLESPEGVEEIRRLQRIYRTEST